jgi:hypothetical protein
VYAKAIANLRKYLSQKWTSMLSPSDYAKTATFGYSGEAVAKALGITRSGVCRGASRGAALVAENPAKWGKLEELINKSTTSP